MIGRYVSVTHSLTVTFRFQQLEARLPIRREVGAESYQPGLMQQTAHGKAEQHARFGFFDRDVDGFQPRLIAQQRRFEPFNREIAWASWYSDRLMMTSERSPPNISSSCAPMRA